MNKVRAPLKDIGAVMSVYDKVQHTMIPTGDVSPQQKAWIGRVADLVTSFSHDIGLDAEREVAMTSFVLQMLGGHLWHKTGGEPCWGQLDVERFLSNLDEGSIGNAYYLKTCTVVTLVGFYGWLSNTNRLKYKKARRVLDALEQRLPECLVGLPAYGEA
jgi:hypothetical protein